MIDSASIRQMVSFSLKNEGYDIVEAVDGVDALDKMKVTIVDMVLTVLHIPNMNGIDLIK